MIERFAQLGIQTITFAGHYKIRFIFMTLLILECTGAQLHPISNKECKS